MNALHSLRRLIPVLLTAVFAVLVLAACDSSVGDFGDTNKDPTEPNNIDPELAFTTVQLGTAGSRYEVWRTNLIYQELIAQHIGTNLGYWVGDDYGLFSGYATSFFRASYNGGPNGAGWTAAIRNVEDLLADLRGEDGQVAPEDVNRMAATRIWRVLIYQRVTDTYGDIPYFEAAKGFLEGEFTPRYTPQDSIYFDMKNELQAAIDQFDESQPTYGSADLVYGGNIAQWKRFANSLQLRLALRIVKVDPSRAESWATEAINSGVMQSNSDIAYIEHQEGPSTGPVGFNTNANSEVYGFGVPRISQAMVDFMKSRDDPRLLAYGEQEASGSIKGWPNGYTSLTIDQHPSWTEESEYGDYLALNSALRSDDAPFFFQTYAEVEFMLAEAAARGWTSGSAESHYDNGVEAAMDYLSLYGEGASISSTEINDYLEQNPYNTGGSLSEKLEQINTQYWAATLLNGWEAWANWRRSGYPKLDPAPVDDPNAGAGSYTEGTIMRRLIYPSSEEDLNTKNYDDARSRQGITGQNMLSKPMWWDCGDLADQCNTSGLGPQADPEDPSNGPGDGPDGAL